MNRPLSTPTRSWPTALSELELGERLIIWSFRRWVSGTEHWPVVWDEFSRQFAPETAPRAMRAFEQFVGAICCRARRVIHYHQACCACLGADEVCVLTVITAAQHDDSELAHATSRWLVHSDGVEALVSAASTLADLMAMEKLRLPQRICGWSNQPVKGPSAPWGSSSVH